MREAWTYGDIAARVGRARHTVMQWHLPEPDVALGKATGWWPETILAWAREHRPDLADQLV